MSKRQDEQVVRLVERLLHYTTLHAGWACPFITEPLFKRLHTAVKLVVKPGDWW